MAATEDSVEEGLRSAASRPRTPSAKVIVVLVVVALFGGLAAAKFIRPAADDGAQNDTSLTSRHNDAVADYEAALQTGRPVYVLFHSLS